jgi:hypothetical protein
MNGLFIAHQKEKNIKTTNILELIKKNENKTNEPGSFLSKITSNPQERDINKINILIFSNDGITKDDNTLINYYCSLCGAGVINTDTTIEIMPRRKTDESMILLLSKIYFKSLLKRDKLMVIKRDTNKYEKQYRFCCQECGVFVAYQSMNYDDNSDEFKRRSNKIFSHNKKKILYILIDAVVTDPRQSSLFIEMDKIKDCQEKIFSFVRMKKTEVDQFGKEKEKIVYL